MGAKHKIQFKRCILRNNQGRFRQANSDVPGCMNRIIYLNNESGEISFQNPIYAYWLKTEYFAKYKHHLSIITNLNNNYERLHKPIG